MAELSSFFSNMKTRRDWEIISELVHRGDRVLDLGCGDGSLLKNLADKFGADVMGLELDQDEICRCIANGVPVVQSDLNDGLNFAGDNEFDLVILSQTLQQVRRPDLLLERIVRVGRTAAVSFINFGNYKCWGQLLVNGIMPRTTRLPYHWYDTPNIHLGTIKDFRILCKEKHIRILKEVPISSSSRFLSRIFPVRFAGGAVFVLERETVNGGAE